MLFHQEVSSLFSDCEIETCCICKARREANELIKAQKEMLSHKAFCISVQLVNPPSVRGATVRSPATRGSGIEGIEGIGRLHFAKWEVYSYFKIPKTSLIWAFFAQTSPALPGRSTSAATPSERPRTGVKTLALFRRNTKVNQSDNKEICVPKRILFSNQSAKVRGFKAHQLFTKTVSKPL